MQDNIFYDFLYSRGISQSVIEKFDVHVGDHMHIGDVIVIPVHDINRDFVFNKYRRNPLDDRKPKYLYDKGGTMQLYGAWKARHHDHVLITEGELDTLVAWSNNIPAVSSTGGANTFKWASFFVDMDVTICFDNDKAGAQGMVKVLEMIPHAHILLIPDAPGVKDISDYVSRGGDLNELMKTRQRFESAQDVINDKAYRLCR